MQKMKCMYKYSLHKKSIKHNCPTCNKKRLVLYIDTENNQFLSPIVGRCDREINCGYHYTPKSFFLDKNQTYKPFTKNLEIAKVKKTDYHNKREVEKAINNYDKNNFVQFLYSNFDLEKVSQILKEYKIGTCESWYNGTIFWQIDILNNIRGGKVIKYDDKGKRTKYINWIHSLNIKNNIADEFKLEQCLFGEHLLNVYEKPVAIVESEKTACIMSLMFDKYLWLATGSLQGLNTKKIEVLRNRKIILYPDLGIEQKNGSPFTIWKSKCDKLKTNGFDIQMSELLEKKGTQNERKNGFDIADYFLKNKDRKPERLLSKNNQTILHMYMKNKNLKNLIEVFNLTDNNGNLIKFE